MLTRKFEYDRTRNIYLGLLKAIHAELGWHENHTRRLKETLDEISCQSQAAGEFIVDNAPEQHPIEWLQSCRERLFEFRDVDIRLVHLLSTYINLVRDTNRYLDFSTIKSLNATGSWDDSERAIKGYFDTLNGQYIEKIFTGITMLRTQIEGNVRKMDSDKDLLPSPSATRESSDSTP